MSLARAPGLPLVLVAATFALAVGGLVWWRQSPPGPLRVGAVVPDFRLPDLEGHVVSLSELRGRVVFVNFWGTWCAPCRDETPSLERLYRHLQGEGFLVLGLSIDGPEGGSAVAAFRSELGLTFPVLLDPARETYSAFGATGVPETFAIDAQGRLAERFVGPRDWDHPRYERAVRRLLDGAAKARAAKAPRAVKAQS